jgi:flagellar motor switch protein FliN/FliY
VKTNDGVKTAQQQFAYEVTDVLVRALSRVTGSMWRSSESDMNPGSAEAEDLHVKIIFQGCIRGEVQLELRLDGAVTLATILLGQSSDAFGEPESTAILNAISERIPELCVLLGNKYGEFTGSCSFMTELGSEWEPPIGIDISDGSVSHIPVWVRFGKGLAAVLEGAIIENVNKLTDESDGSQDTDGQVNLNLVLDVELNVTLRFGRRQLTLREVLELTSGSVIELDRQVEEPVELLLDGKVIARGEAVVIDGNYGLRVTEVPHIIRTAMF